MLLFFDPDATLSSDSVVISCTNPGVVHTINVFAIDDSVVEPTEIFDVIASLNDETLDETTVTLSASTFEVLIQDNDGKLHVDKVLTLLSRLNNTLWEFR